MAWQTLAVYTVLQSIFYGAIETWKYKSNLYKLALGDPVLGDTLGWLNIHFFFFAYFLFPLGVGFHVHFIDFLQWGRAIRKGIYIHDFGINTILMSTSFSQEDSEYSYNTE